MIEAADIIAMLSERVLRNDIYRPTRDKQVQQLIEHLFETIQNFLSASSFEIHDESTLDETDSSEDEFEANECHEHEESAEAMEESDSHSESQEETTESDGQSGEEFSLDYMKKVLNYCDETDKNGKRTHSWKVVIHRFRRIRHQQDISRFREYVRLGGSVRQKLAEINLFVFGLFKDAREQSLCIHDADLIRCGIMKAQQLSMYELSASKHWLTNFKQKYRIVSRKVSKVVSRRSIKNVDEINASAEEFVNVVRAEMKNYPSYEIFNMDQVNLVKKFRSNRTLTFKGEKTTTGSVTSQNANSHSYTIQSIVNMDG